MNAEAIPTLADLLREYLTEGELSELCEIFDVAAEWRESKFAHLTFARKLVLEIEHGNHRRFLSSALQTISNRCDEAVAHNTWERQEYHVGMRNRLREISKSLGESGVPTELTVHEQKPFTAKSKVRDLLALAETSVTVVDNYVGAGTLDCLRDVTQPIRLLTGAHKDAMSSDFERALRDFTAEGFKVEVRRHPKLHDRYLLFNQRCWIVGSSLKDAGKKILNVIECVDSCSSIVAEVEKKWQEAAPSP